MVMTRERMSARVSTELARGAVMIRLKPRFPGRGPEASSCRFSVRAKPDWLVSIIAGAGFLLVSAATVRARGEERAAEGAEQPPPAATPVDVALKEAPSVHRTVTIEWNPLALFIDRFSLNVVVVPGDHHAVVLSPFYTWANTAEYSTGLDAQGNMLGYTLSVPSQTFKGFGGELGYRYYAGTGGPRGFFAGPSFLLDAITATAYNGAQTNFSGYGLAVDAGYQALVADAVSVSVGAGAQYMFTSKSIPSQQLPASIYANERLYPRLLLSFGYAF